MKGIRSDWFPILLGLIILIVIINKSLPDGSVSKEKIIPEESKEKVWEAPSVFSLKDDDQGKLIRYGRDLIGNTSYYLGPKGTIAAKSNGMNCQNCHLDAGTRPYGNSFAGVASTYPVVRSRSGILESVEFRVNDCMQRSMNGQTLDSNSHEMKAMVAYLKWLGKDVPKGERPPGAGTEELKFMDRAADTLKGRIVFEKNCTVCHGVNGQGLLRPDSSGYVYPPLWGPHSYNVGAGLYRLTKFAGYVKFNMPFGTASHDKPVLTDDEAWDVAAFVNSQPRPVKSFPGDWPNISKKSLDTPFGPYADTFSEKQHKYGPFGPIQKAKADKAKK